MASRPPPTLIPTPTLEFSAEKGPDSGRGRGEAWEAREVFALDSSLHSFSSRAQARRYGTSCLGWVRGQQPWRRWPNGRVGLRLSQLSRTLLPSQPPGLAPALLLRSTPGPLLPHSHRRQALGRHRKFKLGDPAPPITRGPLLPVAFTSPEQVRVEDLGEGPHPRAHLLFRAMWP